MLPGLELVPVSERGGKVEHTEDEIRLYGRQIIDIDIDGDDRDLKWLAKHALEAPIPKDWKAYQSSSSGRIPADGGYSSLSSTVSPGQIVYVNQSSN